MDSKTEKYHRNMTNVFQAPNKDAKKNIERHLENEKKKEIEEEKPQDLDEE